METAKSNAPSRTLNGTIDRPASYGAGAVPGSIELATMRIDTAAEIVTPSRLKAGIDSLRSSLADHHTSLGKDGATVRTYGQRIASAIEWFDQTSEVITAQRYNVLQFTIAAVSHAVDQVRRSVKALPPQDLTNEGRMVCYTLARCCVLMLHAVEHISEGKRLAESDPSSALEAFQSFEALMPKLAGILFQSAQYIDKIAAERDLRTPPNTPPE